MKLDYYQIISFGDLRTERQKANNLKCSKSLLTESVNEKAKAKILDDLNRNCNLNKKEVAQKMKNDKAFSRAMGALCAINASRQGVKDETLVIEGVKKYLDSRLESFRMDQRKVNEKVPIKETGEVLSRKDAKLKGYAKTQMLKSFDFDGKVQGRSFHGFAKIVIGAGGHQDNVYHEAQALIDWVEKHKKVDDYYFLLIDTDSGKNSNKNLDALRDKNTMANVFICDHLEIQKLMEKLHG